MVWRFSPVIVSLKKIKPIRIGVLLVPIVLIYASSCAFFFQDSGPVPIRVSTGSFIITWDTEEETITGLPSGTSFFKLYYRELSRGDWIFLKSTEEPINCLTVNSQELNGEGDYEFGVEQVYNNGRSSEIHGSTDFSAKPTGGWYLLLSDQ